MRPDSLVKDTANVIGMAAVKVKNLPSHHIRWRVETMDNPARLAIVPEECHILHLLDITG